MKPLLDKALSVGASLAHRWRFFIARRKPENDQQRCANIGAAFEKCADAEALSA
ncbi:hypothetical protein [Burkholderia pseudomallei]|uniref:hypothetical protein n=1 Tax=Burkholderia pseudomallei TaxID=28450 RepID=UPI0012F4808C|nr:hypothetical protein [Burkholderia pseudomallei]